MLKKENIPDNFFPQDLKIVSVGDSLTEGVGDVTNQGGYTSFLEQQLRSQKGFNDVNIINYGVQGLTTTDLLHRLENDIPEQAMDQADIVIITIGGNDMLQVVQQNFLNLSFDIFEQEQARYESRLKGIIDEIRSMNSEAQIFLVGLYNPFFAIGVLFEEIDMVIKTWNNASKDLLSGYSETTYVEIEDIFEDQSERLLYTDEFHPNTRGYELISERIVETIIKQKTEERSVGSHSNDH